MELPKRKRTRLKNFDYSQNGAYFVTVCTHKRQKLFGAYSKEGLLHLPNRPDLIIKKWLHEIENKFVNVTLDYYVVMPEHLHLILLITQEENKHTLMDIMNWFKTMTTNDYIKNVKEMKFPKFEEHFWQRSFFEHIIRNEKELQEKRVYIKNNPLKPYEQDF